MYHRFELRISQFILALILMLLGAASLFILSHTKLVIGTTNLTSIGLLIGGLILYSGCWSSWRCSRMKPYFP